MVTRAQELAKEVPVGSAMPLISGGVAVERIRQLERAMKASPNQVELPLRHSFAPGVYAREVFIPKGTLLTGKVHRTDHLVVVSAGDITVLTNAGERRIVAPATFVEPALLKKVGFANEDTIWICFHPTEETDLEKLEATFIVPDDEAFGELAPAEAVPCLG